MTLPVHAMAEAMQRNDALVARWVRELPEDFQSRVVSRLRTSSDGCWEWTGSTTHNQYGGVRLPAALGVVDTSGGGPVVRVHRAMWVAMNGPIPVGMVLDHDSPIGCHNPLCANPAHLAVATPRENVHSGMGPAARNFLKTQCIAGHPIDDLANLTKSGTARGKRDCAVCAKARRDRDVALVQRARAITGLTWSQYEREHGRSTRTARSIIDAEEA